MENRVCKKCHKELPEEYKYNKCEACRNAQVQGIKKGVKAVTRSGAVALSIGITVLTKGKITPKK